MRCEQLADLLAATGGETTLLDLRSRDHLDSCLRCQAELAQYRKLLKALRTLRTEVLTPAPGLVSDIFATIEAGARDAAAEAMHSHIIEAWQRRRLPDHSGRRR